jgi:protoporphyrinogen oxidase
MENNKRIVIIGAGPAGLTAAYIALTEGIGQPIVLEAEDYTGGISRTAEYKGNRIDIGGHRFFSKDSEIVQIWEKLMPMQGAPSRDDIATGTVKTLSDTGPDPEAEDEVMLRRRRISRIYYLNRFFDYPLSLKWETFRNMGFRRTVKAGFGYLAACLFRRPEDSLRDFYINRFGKPLYEMFFEDYTEKLWGRDPKDISADWGAQRVKGLSLSRAVLNVLTKPFRGGKTKETSLIEEYSYPKKGPGQLWEKMEQEIIRMGGEVIHGARVTRFEMTDGRISGVIAERNGEEEIFRGDEILSSMPISELVAGLGDAVPERVSEIARTLPYRDFMTVGLLVDRMKLKNTTGYKTLGNIVPDCWIYIQERDVKLGRLQIFNNWSPYMVRDPENTVWIGLEYFCNVGDELWEMEDEAFISFARGELAKIGVIDEDAVLDAVRLRVRRAYPAYFDSYAEFDTVREYLDTVPNLWCIGRNGQHRYNNMDHSMRTAIEAVRAIGRGASDKSAVWKVNTEKEYHEEKTEGTSDARASDAGN